ncbi:MAG: bifunctional phosphoribosyl-AMP cyclohydrolase/phosphoribosyl-ATP diphosphatase HisIE [Bacteroidetes bacterium]|nr:bifunctional phosphoribosyl-AMP cyclohydrolase/phosphoribosyl-ATP diphosphatase HisIE [Bacteroidota bacterium]MBT3747738.1 bifunctional phosphoribosyl-AMP cyclohydrolase/phosphoribosyl-ATP diphosphatase HisIE [Bacteroidota bacterium]MBT4402226.1 bifunctional phosphoribosyl-AMP cyclohydrolase/phosphoribosyl-ATP diphosphatase HisIE [Bacteroidota bacterium]MBT4411338.1 bifunctional phosphoribosyl-AMP cyclohydrolase/phosphoribosyl-ATP diphosphatase HisIE [Bacteroidota bacterium]MBT5428143.1 bifu
MNIDFKKGAGLVPVIIQDYSTQVVLMLAYMNEEAMEETIHSGIVTFYSRSRKKLWTKGETSGNYLEMIEILPDCDADTLLVKVRPYGQVCHKGSDTCFEEENHSSITFLIQLNDFIKERKKNMPADSYTTKLFESGAKRIAQKVGEEAVELALEALSDNDEAFLSESADLMYHLIVLLQERGYDLDDLAGVLAKRHDP